MDNNERSQILRAIQMEGDRTCYVVMQFACLTIGVLCGSRAMHFIMNVLATCIFVGIVRIGFKRLKMLRDCENDGRMETSGKEP